ncbi:hypothetical protein J1N35_032166 [Gossypium stocksii]|uniref:Uncharacterized protein n=1 Tax=Gossypium stocksii TaxID=47602 RepID=A0A9D3ZWF7_9ROSI|nr:hypothetical protein J1N35_032166 [Gossypium stocksii]
MPTAHIEEPALIHFIQLPQNSSELEYPKPETQNTDLGHLIPGFANPVPSCVLPSFLFNKDGGYTAFVKFAGRFKDAKGILINTFEELEPYARRCFSNAQNPPIYPVVPVIQLDGSPNPELDLVQRNRNGLITSLNHQRFFFASEAWEAMNHPK